MEFGPEVARGGAGVVYRAVDRGLQRPVAVKVLRAGWSASTLARFRREVELLSALQHPNLVRVHAAGVEAGRPYVVMEWVEGGSLERALPDAPSRSPRWAVEVACGIARGLEALHAQGVIHRDVKPDNVLLAQGTPKLIDLGLARSLDEESGLTKTGAAYGTPGYWSPEQARGDRAAMGPRSDVYGLGATLYALLSGRPPIEGRSMAELVVQTQEAEPPKLRTLRRDLDPDLEAWVARALKKRPEDRQESMEAFRHGLERWLAGERLAPRRRWVGGLVGVVVAGGAFAASVGREAAPSPPMAEPEVSVQASGEEERPRLEFVAGDQFGWDLELVEDRGRGNSVGMRWELSVEVATVTPERAELEAGIARLRMHWVDSGLRMDFDTDADQANATSVERQVVEWTRSPLRIVVDLGTGDASVEGVEALELGSDALEGLVGVMELVLSDFSRCANPVVLEGLFDACVRWLPGEAPAAGRWRLERGFQSGPKVRLELEGELTEQAGGVQGAVSLRRAYREGVLRRGARGLSPGSLSLEFDARGPARGELSLRYLPGDGDDMPHELRVELTRTSLP